QDDAMKTVRIIRVGTEAKKFNAIEVFGKYYEAFAKAEKERQEKIAKISGMSQEEYKSFMYNEVKVKYPNAVLRPTGLVYIIDKPGDEKRAQKGNQVTLHYSGTLRADGKKFDSSYDRNQPMPFKYLEQRMISGFEEGVTLIGQGGKAKIIIPYYQAYGAQGRPGTIPPYSDLVFDIEILSITESPTEVPHDHDHSDPNHKH
ncbi:MAG: FKBP-type peptidyl-prolyl cis-trans isomerase, partial [Crocinitomicaceae bacterium]